MRGLLVLGVMLALALVLPSAARADEPLRLRLCTSDVPFAPFTLPDGSGEFQQKVKSAAARAGVSLHQTVAPRARCLQWSRNGDVDALIGVHSTEREAWLAYPMRGGRLDTERSVGRVRFVLVRQVGANVRWDGRRISGLGAQSLGVQRGFDYGLNIASLDVPLDDGATSAAQLMAKLERGRIGLALLPEAQIGPWTRQQPPRVEMLEPPFSTLTLYLILTRDFAGRHPEAASRLWEGIGRL